MISKQYCGFRVTQRKDPKAIHFFVFAATARDVLQWSTVDRLEERKGGIQRRLSKARLRAIEKFFELNALNTIPTSIVLAFLPGVATFSPLETGTAEIDCFSTSSFRYQWGILEFGFDPEIEEKDRPALVVDGQHRLLGMASVDEEELPVLVSALLDAEPNEQAFQFIVINNKVTRVPSDLVRSLIVDFDEDALQDRLQTARVSLQPHAFLVAIVDDEPESPLHKMVDWERRRGEGKPSVKPAAIEDSLKYVRKRFAALDEDQDALIDFFFAMWRGVKLAYPELWLHIDNRLFDNAGFKAFSEYLTDQIDVLSGVEYVDILDTKDVTEASRNLTSKINIEFWQSKWKYKSLDTSAGHEIIKEDLRRIRQNKTDGKDWQSGLALIGIETELTESSSQ